MGVVPEHDLEVAIGALGAGLIVAIPTETVYGLAADPTVPGATDRIFAAKRRPHDVALPVLVADRSQALALSVDVPPMALNLMARFWPGPLTIVLRRRPGLPFSLGADDLTIGIRCPDHPVPLALCGAVGPLATTSANIHGRPSPETAADIAALFGASVAEVIDGGPCSGRASTVVDCTGTEPRLLREGGLPWADALSAATG